MSPAYVKLSQKSARAICEAVSCDAFRDPALSRAKDELERALSDSDRKRKKKLAATSRLQKKEKKASKREETSAIYEAVAKRAGGQCECCGLSFAEEGDFAPEMDHFWGRGKARQSPQNCWMLAKRHHLEKGRWSPTRVGWLEVYLRHSRKHGHWSEAAKAEREFDAEIGATSLPATPKAIVRAPAAPEAR